MSVHFEVHVRIPFVCFFSGAWLDWALLSAHGGSSAMECSRGFVVHPGRERCGCRVGGRIDGGSHARGWAAYCGVFGGGRRVGVGECAAGGGSDSDAEVV